MKIEIAIEGPIGAVSELHGRLEGYSPVFKELARKAGGETEWARVVLESRVERLDRTLLEISDIVRGVEKGLSLQAPLEFRTRNTAYSEPSIGSPQFRKPFSPIPSITIRPWDQNIPDAMDGNSILIDPHQSFGTGRHPTTRLCLKYMERMIRSEPPYPVLHNRSMLDFGCGTGLLAMAAVKLGAKMALGVEIHHESARTAKRNIALNHMSDRIEIREGSWRDVSQKYDIIFANLVVSALLRVGGEIPPHIVDHGHAVVSGFGYNQLDDMEAFFNNLGLITIHRSHLDGWGGLFMVKG